MPQYDAHHETVKRALRKDGWTITADPFTIYVEQVKFFTYDPQKHWYLHTFYLHFLCGCAA